MMPSHMPWRRRKNSTSLRRIMVPATFIVPLQQGQMSGSALQAGGRRLEAGGWRLEDGGWRMEDGVWRMEYGGWSRISLA